MKYLLKKIIRSKSIYIVLIIVFCLIFFLLFGGVWKWASEKKLTDYASNETMMFHISYEMVTTIFCIGLGAAFLSSILLSDEIDSGFILTMITQKGGRRRYYLLRWIVSIISMQIFVIFMISIRYMGTFIFVKNNLIKNSLLIMNLYLWAIYAIIGALFISIGMFFGMFFKSRVTIAFVLLLAFITPIMDIAKHNLYKRRYSSIQNEMTINIEPVNSSAIVIPDKDTVSVDDFSLNDYYNKNISVFNWYKERRGDNFYDYISSWKFANPILYIESLFTLAFYGIANKVERESIIKRKSGHIGDITFFQKVIKTKKTIDSINSYIFINIGVREFMRSTLLNINFDDQDVIKQIKNDLIYFKNPANINERTFFLYNIYDATKAIMQPTIDKYKDKIWNTFLNSNTVVKRNWIGTLTNLKDLKKKVKLPGQPNYFETYENWKVNQSLEQAVITINKNGIDETIKIKDIISNWTLALFSSMHPTKETSPYVERVNQTISPRLWFWSIQALDSLSDKNYKSHAVDMKQKWDNIKQEYYWDYEEDYIIKEKFNFIDKDNDGKIFLNEILSTFIQKGLEKIEFIPFISLPISISIFLIATVLFNILYLIAYKKLNIM